MALIPGSYARAAGLQSEINKVTITRVAGGEVQFRRAIDTYQKDLRCNVNQIGREQKLLRRSLKKYHKKLREGKKERRQREAKEREDSNRLKQNARQFKEATKAVRRNVLVLTDPKEEAEGHQDEVAPEESSASEEQNTGLGTLPESPDSGIGSEGDDKLSVDSAAQAGKGEGAKRKVFMTSQKGKMPYFKAKKGQRDKISGNKQSHAHEDFSEEEASEGVTEKGEEGIFLAVINEEGEDGGDQSKLSSAKALLMSAAKSYPETQADEMQHKDTDDGSKDSKRQTHRGRTKIVSMTSLNTKNVTSSGETQMANHTDLEADHQGSRKPSFGTVGAVVMLTTKTSRRKKTDVSYSDLIKLQHTHTSGTKLLFNLVDRLASKHGIGDLPPLKSSRSSSLDPRSNVKIKKRGNGPESQMSDGMVKQAAALYTMKYGYGVLDDAVSDDVIPSDMLSLDVSDAVAGARDVEEFENEHDFTKRNYTNGRSSRKMSVSSRRQDSLDTVIIKDQAEVPPRKLSVIRLKQDSTDVVKIEHTDGHSDTPSRKLSVTSVRRNSTDVTSPYYALSDAASTLFQDSIPDGVTPSVTDLRERRSSRSKGRHLLSMSELSEHASRVREKSFNAPEPYSLTIESNSSAAHQDSTNTHTRRESRSLNRMSPPPRRSRSLYRARRDSVQNQLQLRLRDQNEAGNTAWQSAFGRLKLLHTLHDLSQHFDKDSS
ncbi:uncharacterized protein [Littorina saxatilis]|uniref:Uncharacterized protein n=2 Tax=Littorina saxatilis TaxID=31220 RepID=A0AAN9GPZ3_9CAEN